MALGGICQRRKGRGVEEESPTSIGNTGSTPTATPLEGISDRGTKLGCAKGSFLLAPALALGQPVTKMHAGDVGWEGEGRK